MINVLAWDNDFISPCSDLKKNEVLEEAVQMKHQYILERFPCLKKENTHIYRLYEKDFQYSYGLSGELERKVIQATVECTEAYKNAKKACDYNLVRYQFAELVNKKKEELKCLDVAGNNSYFKLLNYTCGEFFTTIIDNIMDVIKNEIIAHAKSDECNLQNYNPSYISIEDYKKLFEKYGVKSENVIFQRDENNSCLQLNTEDCRVTYTSKISNNIAKHEIGHIIYMQNISNNMPYKAFYNPLSQVFDEAIAMLYEMMIDGMDELKNSFYSRNPIRIQCTNVQRLLHIVLRYELERDLINGVIEPLSIDNIWKLRFSDFFGYELANDNEGVLQDSHWFSGNFGYFPIYNLAFALALVIYYKLDFKQKDYKEILEDLNKYILQYGASKTEKEIFHIIGILDFEEEFKKYFRILFK